MSKKYLLDPFGTAQWICEKPVRVDSTI